MHGSMNIKFGIANRLLAGQIHISFLGRSKNSMSSPQRTEGNSHPNNSLSTEKSFLRGEKAGAKSKCCLN